MKELKDIVLKKGDIVYFEDEGHCSYFGDENGKLSDYYISGHVVKIERPVEIKYETIYEAPKQILDKEEKEYLEAVCKPFKDRVEFIEKRASTREWICIHVDNELIVLPYFKAGTMYKGMESDKKYALKELGLFE